MTTDEYNQFLQQQNALIQPIGSSPYSSNPDDASGGDTSMATMLQGQQNFNNTLQLYKAAQQVKTGSFGPPPAGMSQSQWAGLCEAWAEQQAYGHQGIFPTALAGAQHFAQSGQLNPNITKAPKGALIYFSDPNQSDGHVGIADGKGNFTSATYNGIQTNPLTAWQQSTGQRALGYVIPK